MSWKTRGLSFVLAILTISMLSFTPIVPVTIADEQPPGSIPPCMWGQPRFDEIYYRVFRDPWDAVLEMQAGYLDYIKQVPEINMQLQLETMGFNLSYCEVCELCGFWFNCRDYDGTSGDVNQPLNNYEFRTAVHYLFGYDDKDLMMDFVYGPTMPALDVVVPFAQAQWCAANDPVPCGMPYIGGSNNPMPTSPDIALTLLTSTGFTIQDGPDADGRNELYNPDGTIVRQMQVLYKAGDPLLATLMEIYLCSAGVEGIVGVNEQFKLLGVEEGPDDIPCGGVTYPFALCPAPCCYMMDQMFLTHNFDVVYWCFDTWLRCPLGRFPDWLYHLFHSNFIGHKEYNFMGFRDEAADGLLETVFTGLDLSEIECAVYDFQYYMLYGWNAMIPTNTKIAVSAYGCGGEPEGSCVRWLEDWTVIPTCCSDNHYTWCQMHWRDNPTGECDHVFRHLSQPPCVLHPWYSNTPEEWAFLDRVYEGLLDIHPQTLEDEPFIACDWNITYGDWPELDIKDGMRVTFWLKNDVYWQDGYKVTAEDVKYNWDYLRRYQVPKYRPMWEHLIYTECEGPYKISAYLDTTSLWLLYHLAKTALFFPKWVLLNLDAVVQDPFDPWDIYGPQDFQPTQICYCDFADYCGVPYGPWIDPVTCIPYCVPEDKWMNACMNMLLGTGQYYFDYYDVNMEEGHMVKNTCYWAGHSELFCNIDAYAGNYATGREPYEALLYRQEPCTSAEFEIQVRNTCGHHVDVLIEASLDGTVFEVVVAHIDPWTHVCVHFTSPVVPGCCHYLDQNVTCLATGECCCDGFKPVWWTIPEDSGGTSTAQVMTLFSRPRPRGCCGGFTPPYVDGLIPYITAKQMQIPDCLVDMRDIAPAAAAYGSFPIKMYHGTPPIVWLPGNPYTDTPPEYWAIFVGVNDSMPIPGPWEDAIAMKNRLDQYPGYSPNRKKLHLSGMGKTHPQYPGNASWNEINASISWALQNADDCDIVVFYFSGHGYNDTVDASGEEPDNRDEGIWVGKDGDEQVSDDKLYNEFKKFADRPQLGLILIFDCCHAGGMVDGTSDLQKLANPYNILMAVRKDEEALAGTPNSLYTKYLLQGLEGDDGTTKADKKKGNNDKITTTEELQSYAKINATKPNVHPTEKFKTCYHWPCIKPKWKSCKDINHDFVIDMRDIARMAAKYGWIALTTCS